MMNFFSKKSHFWALSLFILGVLFFAPNSVAAQSSSTIRTKAQSNSIYLPQLQAQLNVALNPPKSVNVEYNKLKVVFLNRVIAGVDVPNAPHFSRVMRTVQLEMKKQFSAEQAQVDAIYNEVKVALGF